MPNSPAPAKNKTGVLFINSVELPGADTFVHALIMRALDRAKYDVHAACPRGADGARTVAFLADIPHLQLLRCDFGPSVTGLSWLGKVSRITSALFPTLLGFVSLARYIRKQGIQVIHATDRPRDAVSCVVLAKLAGVKSVVHVHVKFAEWMGRPVRWAMGQADALVGVSNFVAQSLIDGGYPSHKTHAVLNAIDPEAWDWRTDPEPIRREFGISKDAPLIVCAARLFRGKGQDDVIRALAAIRGALPNVRLLIVGSDDRQAMRTSFTDELKLLARSLGVAEHVIFTGQRSDMPALMAAADVFALPSYEEPFGLVFAEAMAMKKPVVALASGGAPEIVEQGKSGLLSARGDADALAANLLKLLRDSGLRARMGEYGRRRVEEHFALQRLARDMEQVYSAVVASTRSDVDVLQTSRSGVR